MAVVQGSGVCSPGRVDWFNNRRIFEPMDNIPPAEAEERYYALLNQQPMGGLTQTKRPPENPARFICCHWGNMGSVL